MKCRICGNDSLYLYYCQGNDNQFKFYKCPNCHLVNYDLATGQDQGKYTSETYADPYDMSLKQNRDQNESFKFLQKNISTKGRLLDIGCGNGKILVTARDAGWQVSGLELSKFLAESINLKFGIDVVVSNFLDFSPQEDEKFNVVILRHVLEHLPDSITAMQKINSLIIDGGFALLEFPNIDSIEFKVKRFLSNSGIHKKKYRANYVPGHCNEFSRPSFEYLLKITGFELIRWETYTSRKSLSKVYNALSLGSKARALIKKA